MSSSTSRAAADQVVAQRPGDRGQQHVVDGGTGLVADLLHLLQRDRRGPGDTLGDPQLPLQGCRRIGALEQHLRQRLGVGACARRQVEQVRGVPARPRSPRARPPPQRPRGRDGARGRAEERPQRAAAAPEARPLVIGRRDPGVRRLVGEREQDAAERDPVGDAVVDPADQRGAIAVAVDELELPEGLRAIERAGHQVGDEDLERGAVARRGQRDAMEVKVEVEVRVVLPVRPRERRPPLHHPLAKPGKALDHPLPDRLAAPPPSPGGWSNQSTPVITIRLVGWSMCSQAASACDIRCDRAMARDAPRRPREQRRQLLEHRHPRVGPDARVREGGLDQVGQGGVELLPRDAGLGQRAGHADRVEQLVDAVEEALPPLLHVLAAQPEHPAHLRVLVRGDVGRVAGRRHELRGDRGVVAQHVGQEDAVGAAVRDPEARPDRVRERVVDADEGVREGQAGDRRGVRHRRPHLEVVAVRAGARQRVHDQVDRLHAEGVGVGRGEDRDARLQGVGERVDPGVRGDARRHRQGQGRDRRSRRRGPASSRPASPCARPR